MKLNCPVCKKLIEWNDNYPHRPFCSERCKQIDFGDWATEAHSIPGNPRQQMDMQENTGEHLWEGNIDDDF